MSINKTDSWKRIAATLGWTRSSYFLMSAFLATLLVIMVVWWPLVEAYLALFDPGRSLWGQIDWLLLGNFAAMSLLIMAGADLTELWAYFTVERSSQD